MSETPCQPSQQENGHLVTDPADIATETATSNPEQDTTASKREEVSQFSPHAHSAEERGAMSETPDNEFAPGFPERLKEIIRGGAVIMTDWNNAEAAPDAVSCAGKADSSADEPSGGIGTATPAEKAVSGANLDDADEMPVTMSQIGLPKHLPAATEALNQWAKDYGDAARKAEDRTPTSLGDVMRACGQADESAPATGTEAQVCRDIAHRQRRGLAKYGKTVIGNGLSFAQWLQHFYEELLDASIYAKRILTMTHEPENETDSDRNADGVQPASDPVVHRHRKPGAGRKAKPCPGCGAVKSIGSTVKNRIPTRRCKACGFVVRTYPHLANAAKAPA